MAFCVSMFAPRYRVLVTVQRCIRNSITNNQKHFSCRLLSTYAVPNHCALHVVRHDLFPVGCTRISWTPVFRANDAVFYTECSRFGGRRSISDGGDDILKENMTRAQKLKFLVKNYWHVAIPVHIITSAVWLGSFYYLAVSGIDIVKLLESIGAPDSWIETVKSSSAADFVTMYTLYKLFTPIRYAVTIGGTTLSIKFLRQKGWIKPVPNKDQLKKMYEDQKGAFKDLTASYRDKIQTKKGDFIKTKEEIKQHYVEARDGLQKSVIETKKELRKGAKEMSSEWKHIGGLFYRTVKEGLTNSKPKADYVAKLIKDTKKK